MQIVDLYPDLIVTNGKVYTLDSKDNVVKAAAIKDGRFLALGADREIQRLAGPGTQRVDLNGRTAIPGFLDAHIHLLEVGTDLSWLRLFDCQSVEEMMELVRERAASTPPGRWIVGRGWLETNFRDSRLPTRDDIDAVTTEHPVVLIRKFQAYVVNGPVLDIIGIDRDTPSHEGGRIGRDAFGEPNGLLWGTAKNIVQRFMPQPSVEEMKGSLRLAIPEMHRYGITSIIEPGLRPWEIAAFQSLYEEGGLGLRVNLMPSWYGYWGDLERDEQLDYRLDEMGIHSGFGNEWLRIGALKMAMDATFIRPATETSDASQEDVKMQVLHRLDVKALPDYFRRAQELGWDIGIHCVSDHMQAHALETFALVGQEVPRSDARHSIIHGFFPTPRCLELMAEGEIADVLQPNSLYFGGFSRVERRWREIYQPSRKYLDQGVRVIASSDKPYQVSCNPFLGLYALVTRKDQHGHGIVPREAISRGEALRAYTSAGAWLTREERLKGTIEIGKLGDMAVLDRDYFAIPEEEIKEIQVDVTILDGKVVYERVDPAGTL